MSKVKLGDKNIPFIYQGKELLYPNPVKDGLVLWYDFKGMKNSDVTKGIAKDLSGNDNDGVLQNFNYTSESGYNNGLKYDRIDDNLETPLTISKSFTISMTIDINISTGKQFFFGVTLSACYLIKKNDGLHGSVFTTKELTTNSWNGFFSNVSGKCQVILSVNDKEKTVKSYGNGKYISQREIDDKITNFQLTRVGTLNQSNLNPIDGKVLSILVYNRALTDQEIQNNYNLEKERWGL